MNARARSTRGIWLIAAAVSVGLVAGAALALTLRSDHRSAGPSLATSRHILLEAPPMPSHTAGSVVSDSPPPPAVSGAEPGSATARRPHDRLAEEVAILSRAAKYLESGRASDALRALDEHQRKFPNGILREERYSARAQALCALGRQGEGAAEIARLARIAPESPHLARARQACSAGTAPSSGTE